jgi:glutamate-5-semialdehyde dehydrogenase
VCNALETLLVDREIASAFLPVVGRALVDEKITIKACPISLGILDSAEVPAVPASESDWDSEYLDRILSIRTVNGLNEAISHIQRHGSRHTEGIVAEESETIQAFLNHVDASCITVNASTRFNDGGQLGLGAEVGISTSKLHAYGPMGARELTTSRFVVVGKGHVRS